MIIIIIIIQGIPLQYI